MPAYIDRIGRAHEWCAAAEINRLAGNSEAAAFCLATAAEYLTTLSDAQRKRVEVGSLKTAQRIFAESGPAEVAGAKVVGEESKKPGSVDVDILVESKIRPPIGYSVKLQTTFKGVNVRNATPNSLLRSLLATTGLAFEDGLTEDERKHYFQSGEEYADGAVKSQPLGSWAAGVMAARMRSGHGADPAGFVARLLREVRFKDNLLLTVVNARGEFKGFAKNAAGTAERIEADPAGLTFEPRGISVHVFHRGLAIGHVDIYMGSGSDGKGTRLRLAIRRDFAPL